jgi:hypothetical protein
MTSPFVVVSAAFRWVRASMTVARDLLSRKRQILGRRDLVVAELRHNARVIEEWGGKFGLWNDSRGHLSLLRWQQFGDDLAIFKSHNPGLWSDLVSMYAKLQFATGSRSPRLKSEPLHELAKRLEEADL